ncbi:hypothetical protein B0O99DRAFT_268924 [Bisporella sp. PMI_857]|nr:hypothetical protein B0O99DRAFT_268924 [Bisporella sp. PMI_857]
MKLSTFILAVVSATLSLGQSSAIQVPVAWYISELRISNTRHGSGGTWQFNIRDTPYATPPQAINTTCHYYNGGAYYFATDNVPYNAPCDDPSVKFSLVPAGKYFQFNVTHLWGNCGTAAAPTPCNDNGTWSFSHDDVSGQQMDPENNFGQYGSFYRSGLSMYPNRAVPVTRCMFC